MPRHRSEPIRLVVVGGGGVIGGVVGGSGGCYGSIIGSVGVAAGAVGGFYGLAGFVAVVAGGVIVVLVRREWRRPGRAALRMAEWSVRVLPVRDQSRYRKEFESELFELRERSRRVRLGYAARLLVRSVALRRALLDVTPVPSVRERDW